MSNLVVVSDHVLADYATQVSVIWGDDVSDSAEGTDDGQPNGTVFGLVNCLFPTRM